MATSKKILVVGAGIAGAAICYWLKQFGFSPNLIEKSTHLRKGGQALDLRGVAVGLAQEMGIYDEVVNMRTRIERGFHINPDGVVQHEEQGEHFGFRQGDEVEILRGDLVDILMEKIPDVPYYFDQYIKQLLQTPEGVIVTFNNGQSENYDLLIATDGIHSSTRRMVFDQSEYQIVSLGSYLSTFTIPNYLHLNHEEYSCENNHKLLMVGSDHDPELARAAFMWRSTHKLKEARNEAEQKQFLRDTFLDFGWEAKPILNFMEQSDDFYFDSLAQIKMNRWTKGRIALLGDAGYCASPLSGQGNNLALIGAYILAGELKAAQGDHEKAFDRYHSLLRNFVDINQQFGAWVSESYLTGEDVSKELAEERTHQILEKIKTVSNGIILPRY